MTSLQEMPLHRMCAQSFTLNPEQPAIEFAHQWVSWGHGSHHGDGQGHVHGHDQK